jgi:hypothetical protein
VGSHGDVVVLATPSVEPLLEGFDVGGRKGDDVRRHDDRRRGGCVNSTRHCRQRTVARWWHGRGGGTVAPRPVAQPTVTRCDP